MVRPKFNRLSLSLSLRLRSREEAAARISSLLRAADRLAPAKLEVWLKNDYYLVFGSFIELPIFKRTTSIDLFIDWRPNFRLPPAGNFEKLERLILTGIGFVENLSVFLHRCPRLRKLEIFSPVQDKWVTIHLAFSLQISKYMHAHSLHIY